MRMTVSLPDLVLRCVPAVVAGAAVVAADSAWLAAAWAVASRLAYVLFAGISLYAEDRNRALSRRDGAEAACEKFRQRLWPLIFNDTVAIAALCIVTRCTLIAPTPWWLIAAGVLLIVIGVGVKSWAVASIGPGSYYWRDFFLPSENTYRVTGPYRWLSNPMYTVGYAQAYGFALAMGSAPGLVMAAFAHVTILLLHVLVERPHFRRLHGMGKPWVEAPR